jgi:hypothetical protein
MLLLSSVVAPRVSGELGEGVEVVDRVAAGDLV